MAGASIDGAAKELDRQGAHLPLRVRQDLQGRKVCEGPALHSRRDSVAEGNGEARIESPGIGGERGATFRVAPLAQ